MEKPSLDSYLGALESEDLLSMAAQLEELQGHPGWAVYVELLRVQHDKMLWQLVHGRVLTDAAGYAVIQGTIRGLEQAGSSITGKVSDTARRLVEALEREDREDT